jgi:hypothetical protein
MNRNFRSLLKNGSLLLEKRGVVEGGRSMGTPVKAVGVGGWPVYYRFGNTARSLIFFCLAVEVTI